MKKFLYFQPEYVSRFMCDGAKCNARCCKQWTIIIDEKSYEQYSRIEPPEAAEEILSHIKFNDERKVNVIALNEKNCCPFLTEKNLCGLQLKYGEDFLSQTCATYPRITHSLGKIFERSLTLTCPVAAEMVLFSQEPLKFELVEMPEELHSRGGRLMLTIELKMSDDAAELMLENQVAMISILQERTLTIDQRLIVLCFFADKLEEIYSRGMDADEQRKLIAAYESKKFLAEQVPLMFQSVTFDAEKFIRLLIMMLESFYKAKDSKSNVRLPFLNAVIKTLRLHPDKNNFISLSEVAANYKSLAEARKKFLAEYSTFLENFLINELFQQLYPWHYHRRPTRSLSIFLVSYKLFELLTFSAVQNNLSDRDDLLRLTDWYTMDIDHSGLWKEKIFAYLDEQKDFFELMERLFER